MGNEIDIVEIFSQISSICKENRHNELLGAIENSYAAMIRAEADARRKKARSIIRGINAIDKELAMLEFEYDKVKRTSDIDGIPFFDHFILAIQHKRNELIWHKNHLK